MTDALNPSLPVGGSQLQVASELRGIKARLVADKAAVESLQLAIQPLVERGAVGSAMLAAGTHDAGRDALGIGVFSKLLLDLETLAEAQTALEITEQEEEIRTTSGNIKGIVEFQGGFKLQWTIDTIPSGGGAVEVTWKEPFSIACFGAWTSYHNGGTEATCWVSTLPTSTGVEVDHGSGSAKTMITFAIGV